jgi:hypothetical protein
MIFSKNYLCRFFLILSWLINTTIAFLTKHCGLLQCFPTWFIFLFLFLFFMIIFVFLMIFSTIVFVDFFFNIELVENLTFFCKTLWIATVFPHMVFLWFFFKIIFVDFIFLILSWLRITIVAFLIKHYGLL